jgi:hypothetical protein
MSYNQRYVGELVFADAAALSEAVEKLETEEGCDWSECAFEREELQLTGTSLRIDIDGSFPASVFEISVFVLEYLGGYASSGLVECTYESEDGEPFVERVGPDAPHEDRDDHDADE